MNHLNHWKCFRVLHFKCQQKVIQKVRPLMLNRWISNFGGQFGQIFPGNAWKFFRLWKTAPPSNCYEFNYKIIEISSWIHTWKYKKHTRFMCCLVRGVFFLFFCVCRNVTGQWPWIPLFPPIPLSFPVSFAPATVFYFI